MQPDDGLIGGSGKELTCEQRLPSLTQNTLIIQQCCLVVLEIQKSTRQLLSIRKTERAPTGAAPQ